ncbi:MAG: Ig-like domain repeat protein, partial [Chloroflexota bacterium]
ISPASATGTVVFKDGTTTLNGSPATIVNGVATFSTNSLIVGSHTLSAVYSGDSAYNSSTSSNVAYTVNSLTSTTTSLTANPASSSTYGQAVTLTATISPASTAGTVTFKDGTTTLNGSPVAIVNGVATYSISTLITGSHTLSAVYSGDSNYLGSTSSNIAYTVAGVTPYDPLIELQSLLANDRVVGDNFGDTVSLSSDGNTVLIGAPNKTVGLNINQGAAYIFVRSGATWVQQQKLTAGDGATGDRFGYAVSLSNDGNTALVGAYYKTVGANSSQGAAYTFVRNGATWTQQQQLSDTTTGAIGDWFGYAVSLSSDGNTALVGAYQKNNWQGVAYVFVRSGISWSQQQILTASDGVSGDWFGYAVSLSSDGNTALIGTPAKSIGQGVSYVFVRNGTSWLQQGLTLVALGGAAGNRFGDVVSLSGDGNTALIGAHGKNNWQGAAYIFVRSGTTWSQQQEVTAQGGDFGHWVSLSGDGNTALIGAFNEAINGIGGQGAAYIFVRSSTTWSQQQQLTASDGATSNWFGGSVSLSGNGKTALIGAHGKNNLQGAAYLFETQPTLSTSISLTANPASPSLYGQVVTLTATISPTTATGTVTFKDGTTTLNGSPVAIVNGVATYSISTLITGSHTLSAVYYGNSTYISSTSSNVGYAVAGVTLYDPLIELQSLLANDGVVGDNFGYAVSLSSDGNTVLIGAPNKTVGLNINQGATYIFVRSGATWVQQQKLTNGDGATGDRFGWSVALSNDGNTALVGASYKTVNGNSSQGAAYTFVRNGANWTQQQKLTANDGLANDNFGTSVSLSSDGNTALVGAPWKTIGGRGTQGAAYVFARSGATWTQQQQLIDATTGAAADYFGMSVSLSSDGNTALIGSPYKAINTNLHQGVAYVFTRSGTTWTQQQKLNDSVGTAYDELGWSVALSGDGNTAIMGAWNKTTNGNIQRGSTYIFVRSGTTWSQQTILTHSVGMAGDTFGNAVSLSSDGNMALVGASYKDVTGTSGNQGAAYTFVRSGTTWSQQQELMAGNAATGDRFGISASLSGSGKTALIGAFAKNSYQGAAYIFETQPTLSTSTNLTANPASTSTYGQAVTLTATISPASATGTVVFKDGTTTLNGSPATIASGVATFTTSSLSIGNHTLSANYSGDTKVNGSVNYLNYTVVSNSQWVVRSNTDNGLGTTAGTLSYILSQAVGSSPITITFELGSNTTINFTGPLMSSVPTEVTIDGGSTCSQPPAVIISGNAAIGDGLVLNGGNLLRNIWVKGFSNRQIVTNSPLAAFWKKNILQCVKVSR